MASEQTDEDIIATAFIDKIVRVAKNEATLVVIRALDDLAYRASRAGLSSDDIMAVKRDIARQLEKENETP